MEEEMRDPVPASLRYLWRGWRRTTAVRVATPLIEGHGNGPGLAAQRMEIMVPMRAAFQKQTKAVAAGETALLEGDSDSGASAALQEMLQPALHRISAAPGRFDVSCSLFAFRAEPAKAAAP